MKNVKATSLVEIVISSLILAIVFAGLVAGFVAVRKYIARSQKRLTGTDFTRNIFNQTSGCSTSINWGNGTYTSSPVSYTPINIDGSIYGANYTISTPAGANYGQVTANVTFPVD